jgi:HEPN domain-containing protein
MVAFHSQQAIEKSYKAALEEHNQVIPKTHNIITLSKKVEKIIEIEIDEDLVDQLNDLYIDSRYPTDIGFLPDGKPSVEKAKMFYEYASETFEIINKKIKEK